MIPCPQRAASDYDAFSLTENPTNRTPEHMPNAGVTIGTPTQGATPPAGYGFLVVQNDAVNNPGLTGGTATVGTSTKTIKATFALAPSSGYTVSFTAPPSHTAPGPASPVPVVKGLTTTLTVTFGP